MTLEEEKKLVAEKLNISFMITPIIRAPIDEWNPQSERKWWYEIWDKMDDEMFFVYVETLIFNTLEDWAGSTFRYIHTSKPEICWKALIKTLTEM